ncbi:tRNA (cytidine(34)-2'-O)-methyltransferase [Roseospira marina]|uniref:tRNA (cytidine(34)-2'-O)-methyltransferase n=1 Tax=Roseospira marina TaxID=140057 RepID=A0A5M6I9W4_9PROT|nr:TrmH family RNA methyltransferase [Roseospira marina]KAA5605031.1 tRNA (cytidine(34)-2'-O)-methyltransferase [Roseospira marina]MBB4314958.1 tRNA (cytidine/uridine-2'-O-)-methyltransferase [Roseospira marina]MBB5087958.1 tRNA (cytidine/uridine-2'-O-)-methyltransferase [Roseospira marina]
MRIALYQPDMPQNTAATIRLAACLELPLDVIEPCGFVWDDKRLRRVAMDYLDGANLRRHSGWATFRAAEGIAGARLVVLSTQAPARHVDVRYRPTDILLLGRESAGLPAAIHAEADVSVRIPLAPGARSFNVAMAAAMVAGEALRQTDGWPG